MAALLLLEVSPGSIVVVAPCPGPRWLSEKCREFRVQDTRGGRDRRRPNSDRRPSRGAGFGVPSPCGVARVSSRLGQTGSADEVCMRNGVRGALLALVLVASLAGAVEAQYYGQNKVQYRRYEWKSITSD